MVSQEGTHTVTQALPWLPSSTRDLTLSELATAALVVLATTFFIAVVDVASRRDVIQRVRRYLLARHRVLRAPFYRTFV